MDWKIIGVTAVVVIGSYFFLQKAPTMIAIEAPKFPQIEMPDVAGAVKGATENLVTISQSALEKIRAMGEVSVTKISEVSTTALESMKATVEIIPKITMPEFPEIEIPFVGQIKQIGSQFYEWTGSAWEIIKEKGEELKDASWNLIEGAKSQIEPMIGEIKKIGDNFYEWTKGGWKLIQDKIEDVVDVVAGPIRFLGGIWEGFTQALGFLTLKVPRVPFPSIVKKE